LSSLPDSFFEKIPMVFYSCFNTAPIPLSDASVNSSQFLFGSGKARFWFFCMSVRITLIRNLPWLVYLIFESFSFSFNGAIFEPSPGRCGLHQFINPISDCSCRFVGGTLSRCSILSSDVFSFIPCLFIVLPRKSISSWQNLLFSTYIRMLLLLILLKTISR
ncbi:pol polyprotein, partial [Pseudoloma neurophilia]